MSFWASVRGRHGLWLALLAGGLQALSVAWPGSGQAQGWLQLLSLLLLASLLVPLARPPQTAERGSFLSVSLDGEARTLRQDLRMAAWRSGLFAVAWLAGTFWWLHVSMHFLGGMPVLLSAAAVLLLASALGLYYVAAGTVWVVLVRRARWQQRPLAASVLFAALWLLAGCLAVAAINAGECGAG